MSSSARLAELQHIIEALEDHNNIHGLNNDEWAVTQRMASPEHRDPKKMPEPSKTLCRNARVAVLDLRQSKKQHLWHPADLIHNLDPTHGVSEDPTARLVVENADGEGRRQTGVRLETDRPEPVRTPTLHEEVLTLLARQYGPKTPIPDVIPLSVPLTTSSEADDEQQHDAA